MVYDGDTLGIREPSAMRSILITGCNRGLGLGLVRRLVESPRPPNNIFATCRDTSKATVGLRDEAGRSGAGQGRFVDHRALRNLHVITERYLPIGAIATLFAPRVKV